MGGPTYSQGGGKKANKLEFYPDFTVFFPHLEGPQHWVRAPPAPPTALRVNDQKRQETKVNPIEIGDSNHSCSAFILCMISQVLAFPHHFPASNLSEIFTSHPLINEPPGRRE